MMGKKKLSEIKAQLGLVPKKPNARPPRVEDSNDITRALEKALSELEREIKKSSKPKTPRPVKR
jgi:hypothetical protein